MYVLLKTYDVFPPDNISHKHAARMLIPLYTGTPFTIRDVSVHFTNLASYINDGYVYILLTFKKNLNIEFG